jgi:hypothetical protein
MHEVKPRCSEKLDWLHPHADSLLKNNAHEWPDGMRWQNGCGATCLRTQALAFVLLQLTPRLIT